MRPDEILLLDMLLSAREAVEFLRGRSLAELQDDRMLQLALIKSIEVIGEAAARISPEFWSAHPEIPWSQIVGMRHRLVHGYFSINLGRVWETVSDHLPVLIERLEGLVPPEEA